MSDAHQPTPVSRIEIQPCPFIQTITTTTIGIAAGNNTQYIGFSPPVNQMQIQVSSRHAEGIHA